MRRCGYPTPAWLGVGATATHVWHLMDFVDAAPAPELTPSLVEQLMEIIELQAGQASEPHYHWSYARALAKAALQHDLGSQEAPRDVGGPLALDVRADQWASEIWRVVTGQESAATGLSGYSSVVSALVERLRLVYADVPTPRESPDMIHTDLNPGNVLVRDGAVVAVVDIGNAGQARPSHPQRAAHASLTVAGGDGVRTAPRRSRHLRPRRSERTFGATSAPPRARPTRRKRGRG